MLGLPRGEVFAWGTLGLLFLFSIFMSLLFTDIEGNKKDDT